MRVTIMGTALALALAGCGSSAATRPDAEIFGEQCQPGGTFALDGRAAVLGTLNVHVNASGLVEVDTTAELLIAMDVVQTGTDVKVVAEACGIQIPDVPIQGQEKPIHFVVPDATIQSVSGVAGNAVLSSATATCSTFKSDTFTIVLGARFDPTEIRSAPLPEADANGTFRFCPPSADTACALAIGNGCACDQEGDGKVGATLQAFNVPAVDLDEVYVTLRTSFSLDGQVFSSDAVVGDIDATIAQGILGCHKSAGGPCNASEVGAVKNLNPMITQQPGNPSRFRSARVPTTATCADIVAMKDTLFPR
ncbi:MAG: hypothetical protein K8W52_26305 [Deltaproteobacteria bacterium]|nr:hypothetical protein [Deltaproteobacteria bacterium]